MDANYLRQLGFDLSTGLVFRNNKVWGSFNAQGITMSPAGLELIERIEANDDPAKPAPAAELPVAKPAAKAASARKPTKAAPVPADDSSGLTDALSGLETLLDGNK
jgi:hypothetical protein